MFHLVARTPPCPQPPDSPVIHSSTHPFVQCPLLGSASTQASCLALGLHVGALSAVSPLQRAGPETREQPAGENTREGFPRGQLFRGAGRHCCRRSQGCREEEGQRPGQAAEGRPRASAARQGLQPLAGPGCSQGTGGESPRGGRWRGAEARQNEGRGAVQAHCPLTVSGARAGDECSPSGTPKQPAVPAGASRRHPPPRLLAGCYDSPLL